MFDQFQGPGGHEPRWFGRKILIAGAVAALLSLGLCGVGAVIHSSDGMLSVLGFFGLIGSGLLIAVAVLMTLVEVVMVWLRNRLGPRDEGDSR